jgi:hypothetical protein
MTEFKNREQSAAPARVPEHNQQSEPLATYVVGLFHPDGCANLQTRLSIAPRLLNGTMASEARLLYFETACHCQTQYRH